MPRKKQPELPKYEVTLIGKADGGGIAVIQSNAKEVEDEFNEFYIGSGPQKGNVLAPPFNLKQLEKLVQENNTLAPCIDAMEVNVDGTGYVIEADEPVKEGEKGYDEQEKKASNIKDFFDEIYPDTSFLTIRRKLRVDLESTGNAYLEVLRNLEGEIAFIKHVASTTMRLVRLGDPVMVEKEVTRGGETKTYTLEMRERKFCQVVDRNLVYFREFGSSQHLHRTTGLWESEIKARDGGSEEATIQPLDRATEIIHFTLKKDINTPYGVPRWISQLPSALGSRKAEEHNLSFFDSGGIPPLLIVVQGGVLTQPAKDSLNEQMNGRVTNKHRAAILEAQASGGTLDHAGNVKVTVERFGAERQQDSMFENYDKRSGERVRCAFRLPPLFLGKSEDFNFATAFASYMVAEAQVFKPEREEFDEIINNKIMREIGAEGFCFRSLPLSITDVEMQLQAFGLVKDDLEREDRVAAINEIASLELKPKEGDEDEEMQDSISQLLLNPTAAKAPSKGKTVEDVDEGTEEEGAEATTLSKSSVDHLMDLAQGVMQALRSKDISEVDRLLTEAHKLSKDDLKTFKQLLAMQQFTDLSQDPEGLGELAGCTAAVLSAARETLQ